MKKKYKKCRRCGRLFTTNLRYASLCDRCRYKYIKKKREKRWKFIRERILKVLRRSKTPLITSEISRISGFDHELVRKHLHHLAEEKKVERRWFGQYFWEVKHAEGKGNR